MSAESSSTFTSCSCLLCDQSFEVESGVFLDGVERKGLDILRGHLINLHFFVIADIFEVADIPGYLKYWKERFHETSLTDFCTVIKTNTDPDDEEESKDFFMLSPDVLPEDKKIRSKLSMDRLKQVLKDQQKERTETAFSRQCLFCKTVITGNRKDILEHLKTKHNFSVGHPDNLVYVSQFLDVIDSKLSGLKCLYCDNTFKDWDVLKEHMRKKQHKQLNPENAEYDRFYLINYLEPGKTWKSMLNERDDFDDKDDWNDWIEEASALKVEIICLFCKESRSDIQSLKEHMIDAHSFDMDTLFKKYSFYDRVKIVNYIRKQVSQSKCPVCQSTVSSVSQHILETQHSNCIPDDSTWNQPEYYFPFLENDQLLCFIENEDNEGPEDETESILPEEIKHLEWKDVPEEVKQLITRTSSDK